METQVGANGANETTLPLIERELTHARTRVLEATTLKAQTHWEARACALIALACLAVAIIMSGELHKTRLDIEASKDRTDVLIAHIDGLVPRQAQHALCVGKKVEMGLPRPGATDMGVPFACPNPDDGACVTGPDGKPLLAQVAEARCVAGKL